MRKLFGVVFLVFLLSLTLLSSCRSTVISEAFETDSKHYIQYPQLNGKEYSDVNTLIKNTVNHYWEELTSNEDVDYLLIDYRITHKSDNLLSIVFEGSLNVRTAAHPTDLFYTLNIDLNRSKKLRLSDIYYVNQDFARVIIDKWQAYLNECNSEAPTDTTEIDSNEDILNYLKQADNDSIICSYFTDKKVGVSISVSHVMCDHMEIEIEKDKLKEYIVNTEYSD
jgi:hypothetical protein